MIGLSVLGIRKYFPQNGVEALSGVSFDLVPGEIHALVGENGAGKSTLVQILAGHLEASSGRIEIDGAEQRFQSPAEALAAGIGLVRQHPRAIPGFALWEDCILGAEPAKRRLVDRNAARDAVAELSCRWGFDLDPDAKTENLTVSQRQKAAMLSLLMRGVRYFLLDEPTAVLAPTETDRLFALLSALKEEGKGIALISHKLPETLSVADRVTVLRRGRAEGTMKAKALDAERLGKLMFGEDRAQAAFEAAERISASRKKARETADSPADTAVLAVRGLAVRENGRAHLRGVDFELRKGRILGIAGVRDSGLETLELALAGLLPKTEGSIAVNGTTINGGGAGEVRSAGAAYVPADRMGTALAPRLSLIDNLTVHECRDARGLIDRRKQTLRAQEIQRSADVGGDIRRTANSFSGGTLQKLILAREFSRRPGLLILAEPGWGLDAASRSALDERIRRFSAEGGAVLLLSTDMDELISLADEIATLRNGAISGRFRMVESGPRIREAIGAAMVGSEACVDRA